VQEVLGGGPDDDAMDLAAEALRQAEVEAVQPETAAPIEPADVDPAQLERMSIDELRALAGALGVPDRSTITEQDELIAAIRRCL
jgi:hypothetical protein